MLAQTCTCSQTHVQMKHSLAHLRDLIPTLAGDVAYMFIPAEVRIKFCTCARECFICTCVWLHVYVLANSYRQVDYIYIAQYSQLV